MKTSLVLVALGIVLLVITTVETIGHYDGLGLECMGLTLVGLGGIFAIVEITGAAQNRKSHSNDPENEAVDSGKPEAGKAEKPKLSWGSWGSWVALGVFGLIACLIVFFIIWFFKWIPGPI
ncbi:MAG: hypothetical protein OSA83_16445 [Pseudomonadales bacterium]|jgi:hypothetical protein|nr:hypothetical protein [Pseudomonadales bacterium]